MHLFLQWHKQSVGGKKCFAPGCRAKEHTDVCKGTVDSSPMAPLPWVTGDILSVLRLAVFLLHCRDFFFSSLVWSAGDKLFFFSVSLLSGRELPALGSWVHSLAADSRCDAGWAISLPLSPPCSSLNWVGGVHWQRYEILGSSFERNEVGFVGRRNCIEVGRSVAFCVSRVSRVGVLA